MRIENSIFWIPIRKRTYLHFCPHYFVETSVQKMSLNNKCCFELFSGFYSKRIFHLIPHRLSPRRKSEELDDFTTLINPLTARDTPKWVFPGASISCCCSSNVEDDSPSYSRIYRSHGHYKKHLRHPHRATSRAKAGGKSSIAKYE